MTLEEAINTIKTFLDICGDSLKPCGYSAVVTAIDTLEAQIEAEKKPKRRIDTMSEEELAKTISEMLYQYGSYGIAHYLLSPATEEKEEKNDSRVC